jgi:hypothetical protein
VVRVAVIHDGLVVDRVAAERARHDKQCAAPDWWAQPSLEPEPKLMKAGPMDVGGDGVAGLVVGGGFARSVSPHGWLPWPLPL